MACCKEIVFYKPPSKLRFHWGRPYSVIDEIVLNDHTRVVPCCAIGHTSSKVQLLR